MSDERLQILKMLEEGKISSEEAMQLLEALDHAEPESNPTDVISDGIGKASRQAKWVRIEVQERNGNRVHIKLPVIILRAALRLGGHFNIGGFNSDKLSPELMDELSEAIIEGEPGVLVDVTEENGNHVQIFLE